MDPTLLPAQDNPVVLVAEDEVLVRMMTVDVLEEAGCAVIETENAAAALAVLDERSDVQVLITDVEMPPGPLMGAVSPRAEAKRMWQRRTLNPSDERSPVCKACRSGSLNSRTKRGFIPQRMPYGLQTNNLR
jgi:CheY-like chemotaxis protein